MSGECSPILVADGGMKCEYCGHAFDPDGVPTTTIPSAMLYRCPNCERWTEDG
jgi:DNA-directed RNA polymerase subunit RPC12/RpoP